MAVAKDNQDYVEVRQSLIKDAGKGLFANRNFQVGEQIWSQKRPLVAVLDHATLSEACSNCFGQQDDVIRSWLDESALFEVKACVQCKLLKFCSKACQASAWKRHHSAECKTLAKCLAYDAMRPSCCSPTCRALMQLLAMRKNKAVDDAMWKDILSLQAEDRYEDAKDEEAQEELEFVKTATLVVRDPSLDAKMARKLLCILKRNTFILVSSTFDTIGQAFDPLVSRANHDCQPNSCIVLDGAQISLRSVRPIAKDAEVTLSYIDNTVGYYERGRILHQNWGFDCHCTTCVLKATTWRDGLPLADEIPLKIKNDALEAIRGSSHPEAKLVNLMHLVSEEDGESEFGASAVKAQAAVLREEYQKLKNATSKQRGLHLEKIEQFLRATKAWPLYFQPRTTNRHDLLLSCIEAGQYVYAAKLSGGIYLLADTVHLPEMHHPLRTVHGVRLLQLLNSLDEEDRSALPFDLSLVLFDLARKLIEATKSTHGENSSFHRAVFTRLGTEVLQMAMSAQTIARQELENKVQEEMSKVKLWAVGAEDIDIVERSFKASTKATRKTSRSADAL